MTFVSDAPFPLPLLGYDIKSPLLTPALEHAHLLCSCDF